MSNVSFIVTLYRKDTGALTFEFPVDGVSPESITWTRNGELIGTKSIYRIPGLSTSTIQLFFSIGLNRPGEKVLVSTGTSPDLPVEGGGSNSEVCSSKTTFRPNTSEFGEVGILESQTHINVEE